MQTVTPLRQRPLDIAILAFFVVNLLFVTYGVDLEQLVIADPSSFDYPLWPPPFWVDLVHWWGSHFDPVLMARPMWWRMTIWIDVLFFGPFYAVAIYALVKGKGWIRVPSIFYSGLLLANVLIILGEEIGGAHSSPALGWVLLVNAPWLLFPFVITYRFWRSDGHPFSMPQPTRPQP